MTPAADERIRRLYGLPLEEFTPARNALAAELRAAGDGAAAKSVKELRKPTAVAWAVNQVVRAEPDLVEALLGAGGELRQAHRQAASGRGAAQLRAAAEAERAAIELLLARAAQVVGRPLSPAQLESMRNTLHAASSNDEARELVATGTLTTELRPVGLGPVPAPAARAESPVAVDRRAEERAEKLQAATAAETALQREADAAARAVERAEEAHARAREVADAAAARLEDARGRLRDARAGLRDAQRRRARLERRG